MTVLLYGVALKLRGEPALTKKRTLPKQGPFSYPILTISVLPIMLMNFLL